MGAWGEEPKDNDTTWDLWGYCCEAINAVAGARWCGDTQGRFEQAGLVQLLLEKGVHVRYMLVVQAVADLREALADEKWMARWKSPKTAAKTITRIADAMEAVLKQVGKVKTRGRRREEVLAWNGWPGPEVERGSWTGLFRVKQRMRKKRWKAKR